VPGDEGSQPCRTVLDELPYAPALLANASADLRARVYAAFQVHALNHAEPHQTTISATVTDQADSARNRPSDLGEPEDPPV
jgi:hypothetical protein